jgi:hypothetical protein
MSGMNGRSPYPTAAPGGRFDLSPSAGRASGTGSEAALFHGYSRAAETDGVGVEERPCICGGVVHADPAAPARGVQAHNFTARHKAWRSNRELD